jgi:hypothetical protein
MGRLLVLILPHANCITRKASSGHQTEHGMTMCISSS